MYFNVIGLVFSFPWHRARLNKEGGNVLLCLQISCEEARGEERGVEGQRGVPLLTLCL